MIFNRSHYEDVLVTRVHDLVPKRVWSAHDRIQRIRSCSSRTAPRSQSSCTSARRSSSRASSSASTIRQRRWKISETDYTERKLWPTYVDAFEEAIRRTSTKHAPWFVVPSDHKWFRDLAISQIVTATLGT